MTEPNGSHALVIEGIIADNGDGLTVVFALEQLERIRAGLLQANDGLEILLGRTPTTAEIRAEWRRMKRGK